MSLTAVATAALALFAVAGPAHAAGAGASDLGPNGLAAKHFAQPMIHTARPASATPFGLSPAKIKSAYHYSTSATAGAGKTIAIVDAFNAPNAEADLGVFSSQYGLPACTTANGCFKKVNQTGGTSYPATDANWALEISLDIQWAHAIAPGAKILLVEATTNSFANLITGVNYAKNHATYVSNSYGAGEFSGEQSYDQYFVKSGVSFFFASGDGGAPGLYPAASPKVIAVGGTTLHFTSGGAFSSETGWSGSGGMCSTMEPATAAQSGFAQYASLGCAGKRAVPDLSLDADPNSGVSVYDSTPYMGNSQWWQVGGTSAATPMIAARSAVLGSVINSAKIYGSSITFRDIKSGNNGFACKVGEDLVTGRGSWIN